MIQPTVGRIVWYRSSLRPGQVERDGPQAAIVVHVHSERIVNLVVLGPSGQVTPMVGVDLVQEGDEAPTLRGYCEWMPYQKGQAAKTESLEAAARKVS